LFRKWTPADSEHEWSIVIAKRLARTDCGAAMAARGITAVALTQTATSCCTTPTAAQRFSTTNREHHRGVHAARRIPKRAAKADDAR